MRLVAKAPLQAPGSAKLNDFADFVFEVYEESGRPIGTARPGYSRPIIAGYSRPIIAAR